MDGKQDMEVVNVAIQRLIEDEKAEKKRTRQVSVDGDIFGVEDDSSEDQILLSKLLSRVCNESNHSLISFCSAFVESQLPIIWWRLLGMRFD